MFLKVKLNSLGVSASERIRAEIEGVYKDTVNSVEICKEPRRVRSTKTGVLNIPHNTVLTTYGNPKHFTCGTNIDLAIFPELEPLCKDIKTEIDWNSILKGDLVEIVADWDYVGKVMFIDETFIELSFTNECGLVNNSVYIGKLSIKAITIIRETQV